MTTSLILPDRSRAIALYDRIADPLAFINSMGDDFANSGMFGCQNKQQGRVLAMAVVAENKSPIELARVYHIMDGKLSMKSEAMLAEFRARGGKQRQIQRDADAAEIELTMDGQVNRYRLTWEEAQQESFVWTKDKSGKRAVKYNWSTPRSRMQMLWARVVSDGVRAMAPEVVSGYYTPEEISDFGESDDEPAAAAKRTRKATAAADSNGATTAAPSPTPQADQQHQQPQADEPPFDVNGNDEKNVIDAEIVTSNEVPTGTPTGGTTGTEMSVDDPCTPTQVNQIKSLLNDIGTVDPSIHDKIKANLAGRGRNTLADLTWKEAEGLFKALSQKAHQVFAEQALAGKGGAADAKN